MVSSLTVATRSVPDRYIRKKVINDSCLLQANVIPDYAAGRMYARAVTRKQLAELKVKVESCFKAAAIATGCQVKLSWAPYGPVDGKTYAWMYF